MPEIEVETSEGLEEVNIEFFCSQCGDGICSNYLAGKTYGRKQPFFHAEPCSCQTDRIKELEAENEELQKTIDSLSIEVEDLKSEMLNIEENYNAGPRIYNT
jgi:hypothetical protein